MNLKVCLRRIGAGRKAEKHVTFNPEAEPPRPLARLKQC